MFASPRAVIHNVHFLLFCRRHFYENSWDDSSALKCLQFVRFGGGDYRSTCEAQINMSPFPLMGLQNFTCVINSFHEFQGCIL